MSTILLPVEIESCDRIDAAALWHESLVGLRDLEEHLGPGITSELPDEDRYYRLAIGGHAIGLGWTRRFAAAGYVRWFGLALLPEARGHGFAQDCARAIIGGIFRDFPDCTTILAMIHDTNPSALWRPSQRGRMRYIGTIESTTPEGGAIHLMQMTRETWSRPR